MPNIRQYEAPQGLTLQPSDAPIQATLRAGQSISRDLSQAASTVQQVGSQTAAAGEHFARDLNSSIQTAGKVAVDYFTHREISQGAAEYAKLNDTLTQGWNRIAKGADPNDPTVAEKYRQEVLEPSLEKFGSSFNTEGGQSWAEARVASLRNHMFEKTAADMTTLAGAAVLTNVRQVQNSMTNTAMNDPSAVPHLLEGIDGTIGAMVDSAPNLKGAMSAKVRMQATEEMREKIVEAGAMGAVARSPDPEATAKAWGERYPEYISGDKLKALSGNARQQIRADRIDQTYRETLEKKARQDRSDATEGDILRRLYSGDPLEQEKVSSKAIVNDPNLTREAKERMIRLVDRELKPETATQASNRNAMDLLSRIRKPDGDTDRISSLDPLYEARIGGKINKTDFDMLRKEFDDIRTPEGARLSTRKADFIKAVTPSIDKSNPLQGKMDQDGKLNTYRLSVDLDRKIDEYRKDGKDPYTLLDPHSPDYFGNPGNLQQYQKTLQQSIQDQVRKLTGTAVVQPDQFASDNKNFFSSGRAARSGISSAAGENIVTVSTAAGQQFQANKFAAPHFQAFIDDLEKQGYKVEAVGGYSNRNKVGGSTLSEHAFGNAIDINPDSNAFRSGKTDLPANVSELAKKHGLIWGGNWKGSSNDPMHFEWAGNDAGGAPPPRIAQKNPGESPADYLARVGRR